MCNSTKASYLFQRDKQNYDVSFDTGDKSIQCGRLNDVLKLWIMWKAKVHVPHYCIIIIYLLILHAGKEWICQTNGQLNLACKVCNNYTSLECMNILFFVCRYLAKRVKERDDFELILVSNNCC